jgi:hypothetical protein
MVDMLREPVELTDRDLSEVAGGIGGSLVDINIPVSINVSVSAGNLGIGAVGVFASGNSNLKIAGIGAVNGNVSF